MVKLTTKEGQPYKALVQLDPAIKDKNNNFEVTQFHENYGFDLKTAVGKFAVAKMKDPEKEKALVLSINKANDPTKKYKEVFISVGGVLSKVYRTEVSPEEYLAYTTEEKEKMKVQAGFCRFCGHLVYCQPCVAAYC
jgi:TraG P-loop domain